MDKRMTQSSQPVKATGAQLWACYWLAFTCTAFASDAPDWLPDTR
jgi:hypothetical protein